MSAQIAATPIVKGEQAEIILNEMKKEPSKASRLGAMRLLKKHKKF